MPGEDQERFEDYLELEHYIAELQSGRVVRPPAEMTPSQAEIYRMAMLFHAASPGAAEPDADFAADLHSRLEQEVAMTAITQSIPVVRPSHAPELPAQPVLQQQPKRGLRQLNVSRRALLTGGATIAASIAAGAGIDHLLTNTKQPATGVTQPSAQWSDKLIADGVPTTWHFVTTLDQLGNDAFHFSTDTVTGFLIRDDSDDGSIIAMSAACTHMGCLVQWQSIQRNFLCPCHGRVFDTYGGISGTGGPSSYSYPLPRLETRVDVAGNVSVKVPIGKSAK